MAYPTKYTRQYDYSSYQNSNPNRPLPGDKHNVDYDALVLSVGEIVDFLKGFSRADGKLANGSVGLDQLDPNIDLGFELPTSWLGNTAYSASSTVFYAGAFYKANAAHTSGDTFDGSKWTLIFDLTTGIVRYDTAQTLTSGEKTQAIANLGGTATGQALLQTASAAAARTTLGLGDSATKNVGTTAGTVMAGDDARVTAAAVITRPSAVLFFPATNQTSATPWEIATPTGADVDVSSTTSQGLSEAFNWAIYNGWPMDGRGGTFKRVSSQTGTLTLNSPTVTGLADTSMLQAGDSPTVVDNSGGVGIPNFTTILSVDSATQITLSANASASKTATISFARDNVATTVVRPSAPIYLPPAENWACRMRNVMLNFDQNLAGGLFFDSCMVVDFIWEGIIIATVSSDNQGTGVVWFQPRNPVPKDNIATITSSRFHLGSLACGSTGAGSYGNCVIYDMAHGSITDVMFSSYELNGSGSSQRGVLVANVNPGVFKGVNSNITVIHGMINKGVELGTGTADAAYINNGNWMLGRISQLTTSTAQGFSTYGKGGNLFIEEVSGTSFDKAYELKSSSAGLKGHIGIVTGNSNASLDSGTNNDLTIGVGS